MDENLNGSNNTLSHTVSDKPYHKYGSPLNVLKFSDDDKIIIQNEELKQMLQHPNVKFRKIVPFSIIGAYRKGKSFFLDYCLRFLYAHYPSINCPNLVNPENWMGEKDEPLRGFSWRPGATRDTTGIIIWSDVFLHKHEMTGEEIAIIVMDTQGLFDNLTTATGNSRIFALGTLISSIQVLNLSGVVQEDQLQYLQFATEFAKFAAADKNGSNAKPFQNLMFLNRDWVNWKDHDYGLEGGMTYLDAFLEIKPHQREELKSVRQFIKASFEELTCFLLPHPGDRVTGCKKNQLPYDGNWGEMDEDFVEELKILTEYLLKPERLVLKKINENELEAEEYFGYLDNYFHLFQSDEVPEAKTIYETTVEKNMNILIDLCYERYIGNIIQNEELIQTVDQIIIVHRMSKTDALLLYKQSKKMGNKNHDKKFKDDLTRKIEDYYKSWMNTSETNLREIEEQKEKTRRILQEKHEYHLKMIDDEKAALEQILAEMEKENKVIFEREEKLNKDKIAKEKLKGENKIKKAIKNLEVEIENCKSSIENEKNTTTKELNEQKQKLEEELEIFIANAEIELAEIGRQIDNVKISKENEILEIRTEELNNKKAAEKAEEERQEAIKKKMEDEIERDNYEKLYAKEASKPLWKSSRINSKLPTPTPILVGHDSDEDPVYVGSAICGDTEYPARVVPDKNICSISHNGVEYFKNEYYVLSGTIYSWIGSSEGNIPYNAVCTGYTEDNDRIIVARTKYKNLWMLGKVIGNQNFITIPYKNKEVMAHTYEVLVRN